MTCTAPALVADVATAAFVSVGAKAEQKQRQALQYVRVSSKTSPKARHVRLVVLTNGQFACL
jgi:hypothetical protein